MRFAVIVTALLTVTLVLGSLQWVILKLNLASHKAIPTLFHRAVLALIGVRVHVDGQCHSGRPLLIVANHSSWLDISVIASLIPVVFVAKQEIASWPLFGTLARLQRTLFIDRDRRHKTSDANARIAQHLAEGDPVLLFAEGTAGDGNRVLPFRSALIGAAREAFADTEQAVPVVIQPMAIAYVGLQGIPAGRQHRPVLSWYGDVKLVPHLTRMIATGGVDVLVRFGEPLVYDGGADRKTVAKTLETTVRALSSAARRSRVDLLVREGAGFLPVEKPV